MKLKEEVQLNEYKIFFNNTSDFSCIANTEGYFEIINPNFEKVLGYSERELLENQFLNFVHPEDLIATLKEIDKLKSNVKTINFVNRYRKKDGSYLWFDWNATPDPATGKVYAIARDITQRKRAEQALLEKQTILKELNHRLLLATDSAKIGIFDWEIEPNILNWDDTMYEIFGVTRDKFSGAFEAWSSTVHPDDLQRGLEEVQAALDGTKEFHTYFRIIWPNKEVRYVEGNAIVIRNAAGKAVRMIGMNRDISGQKKAEEQLLTANKELEAFSYSVSHDLRAPLRALSGYAGILSEDYGHKLDEEGQRIVNAIQYNATKMGSLVDNLLAFSRLGRKDLQKVKVDMNMLVQDVLFEINKTITHQAAIQAGPFPVVSGDHSLLFQVMFNLISNAVKYTSRKEHPVIEISAREENDEIIFSVKDNGAGFDMQYAGKLFGVFQRLHLDREFEGTGIGLAIVNRIVGRHGGRAWAEGKVDEGATFYFALPKS